MARIRTIKPEFWTDEDMAEVSEAACLLAIGLLNYADDEGYFNANPKLIKAAVFPIREPSVSIPVMLRELSNHGYLSMFSTPDNRDFGLIRNFGKHQVVNKPRASKIKEMELLPYNYGSDTGGLPSGMDQGSGNGKDKTPHNAHAREGDFLPEDQPFPMFEVWKPSAKAQQEYNPAELEDFVLFWQSGKQEFNQDQWEQKFTRSVLRYREHAKTKKPGGSYAKQNTANVSAFEQVRARHNEWRISQGLDPLGDDGGDLCQPLGSQERSGTLHDLGPDDFAVLG